jgi:hypothetical protein
MYVRTELGRVERQDEARADGVEPQVEHGLEGEDPIVFFKKMYFLCGCGELNRVERI